MYSFHSLKINSYADRPVPNTLYRQKIVTEQTALVFPGFGYTCQMPLLFYSIEALLQKGLNVLTVEYNYSKDAQFRALSKEEQIGRLHADVEASYRAAQNQGYSNIVTLAGKSLGTRAIAYLLREHSELRNAKVVWLTPLIKGQDLREQIAGHEAGNLIAIGTADPHYNVDVLYSLQDNPRISVVLIEDGDHGLQIQGDLNRSLEALSKVITSVNQFL
jgi:predicted alpha/beta-hydrolase family hydrolase